MQDPSLISLSNVVGKDGIVVTEEDDPMPQFSKDGLEIVEGVNSTVPVVSPNKGTTPASDTLNIVNLGEDPMAGLVGDPDFESDDDKGRDAGTSAGTDGAEAGDNDKDPNKTVLVDENTMSVKDAKTEAAENTKS